MKLMVKKSAILQYVLIYILICWNDSFVYSRIFSGYVQIVAITLVIISALIAKYRDLRGLVLSGFLLIVVLLLRVIYGGIGLDVWALWVSSIFVVIIAIRCDKNRFFNRYVKTIIALAVISIIFYALSNIWPNFFLSLPFSHYRSGWTYAVWSSGSSYRLYDYWNRGLLFYVSRENETRNISIFNEPGLYQMHLNITLFIVLFMNDYTFLNKAKTMRYVMIIIIALLTCQSTTGFVSLAAIILCYIISNNDKYLSIRKKIIIGFLLVFAVLSFEYYINGENSIFYRTVINKLFVQSMNVNESTATISSGAYRLETIIQSLEIIIKYPFGCGYDKVLSILGDSSVSGATFFIDIAAIGIIPVGVIMLFIFSPIAKSTLTKSGKLLFGFLYFNTVLAQSSEMYPALLIIPIFLSYYFEHEIKIGTSELKA